MLIPHSGEESVVISYGILDAKIQKNPLLPNKVADFFLFKVIFLTLLYRLILFTYLKGEEQCIIVWEWEWGEFTLHSISDKPEEIKKHIKKK